MDAIADDQLRLIFTCCHPALSPDAQVALTLRTSGGLTTGEIAGLPRARGDYGPAARAGQTQDPRRRHPFAVPEAAQRAERLDAVLHVLYLVFNEGYRATAGDQLIRHDLCAEAIRLGRVLSELVPDEPEVDGLLALMLLHDSRARPASTPRAISSCSPIRTAACGTAIRSPPAPSASDRRWPSDALGPTSSRPRSPPSTPRRHRRRRRTGSTSPGCTACWRASPSPIVSLNRAVAIAMADGPAVGLTLVDESLQKAHSPTTTSSTPRADLLRRLDRRAEARRMSALALSPPEPTRGSCAAASTS